MIAPGDKVYVLIRQDLPSGSKLAQVVHGQDEFRAAHPEVHGAWREASNTVAVLHVRDEAHLHERYEKAMQKDVPCAVFREPDMEDAATCLVLGPSKHTRRLTSNLPLAF